MNGATLRRAGLWSLLVAALGLLIYPWLWPEAAEATNSMRETPVGKVAAAGLGLILLGYIVDFLATPRARCRRCPGWAVSGSALCRTHKAELVRVARQTLGVYRERA